MKQFFTTSAIFLLTFFLAVGAEGRAFLKAAEGHCESISFVEGYAKSALAEVGEPMRMKLEKYSFDSVDPLHDFSELKEDAQKAAAGVVQKLVKCEPSDGIYTALFSHPDWGARTMIVAMSQASRADEINLTEPLAGYFIAMLNERLVPPKLPKNCTPRAPWTSADFNSTTARTWYRWRALMWAECSSGEVVSYLPEAGWAEATAEQKQAILESNPVDP